MIEIIKTDKKLIVCPNCNCKAEISYDFLKESSAKTNLDIDYCLTCWYCGFTGHIVANGQMIKEVSYTFKEYI